MKIDIFLVRGSDNTVSHEATLLRPWPRQYNLEHVTLIMIIFSEEYNCWQIRIMGIRVNDFID